MATRTELISSPFIWRRIHSLMGLWLILFLIQHLVVNSQAALWLKDDGSIFIRLVNLYNTFPYLHVIEVVFIGIPIALHGVWGIKRALTAKSNSSKSDGSSPSLPFGRNRAFRWQRLTSWILLVGILGHVVQMRFIDYPEKIQEGKEVRYRVVLKDDPDLAPLAERIDVKLVQEGDQMIASAGSVGKAILLTVRETFKSGTMCILYTIFVLAAAFHAFNGFWTSLITWGALLSYRSQNAVLPICWAGVGLLVFLGLASIWGSYWINFQV